MQTADLIKLLISCAQALLAQTWMCVALQRVMRGAEGTVEAPGAAWHKAMSHQKDGKSPGLTARRGGARTGRGRCAVTAADLPSILPPHTARLCCTAYPEMTPRAVLCLALTALLPAVLTTDTGPGLPAPSNVRIDSYNMKHVVRWDPVEVMEDSMPVMYSVAFMMYSDSRELCTNITETECDATSKILSFYRGKPTVRAESGARRSDWVVLPDFQPSKNTTIGPVKSLVLHSHSGKLMVDFSPPFSPIPNSWQMHYNLSYWREDSEHKETEILTSTSTYTLDSLKPNTKYCVQVYAFTRYIKGLASDPVCATTVTDNTLPVVLGCIFGVVFLVGIISLLVIPDKPIQKVLSRVKNWLNGPYKIPAHVLECLDDPSPMVCADCAQDTFEEQYDNLSIVRGEVCQDGSGETIPDESQMGLEKT